MRTLAIFGLALAIFGASPASAADSAGWYVGIYTGSSARSDADLKASMTKGGFNHASPFRHPETIANNPSAPLTPEALRIGDVYLENSPYAQGGLFDGIFWDGALSFDRALTLDFAVGYSLGNGARVEAHYAGAQFDAAVADLPDAIHYSALGVISPDGAVWTWRDFLSDGRKPGVSGDAAYVLGMDVFYTRADFFLIDGWYDFDTGTSITPYLGGGLGAALISATAQSATIDYGTSSQLVPAAELGAGLRIKLADPVTLDLAYRYRLAAASDVGFDRYEWGGLLPTVFSIRQSGPISIHALSAGLTFALN